MRQELTGPAPAAPIVAPVRPHRAARRGGKTMSTQFLNQRDLDLAHSLDRTFSVANCKSRSDRSMKRLSRAVVRAFAAASFALVVAASATAARPPIVPQRMAQPVAAQ